MSVTAVPLQPTAKNTRMWMWLGVIFAVLLAAGFAWMGTRAEVAAKGTNEQYLAWNKGRSGMQATASGLQYQVIEQGEGPNIADGDVATVQIEGFKRDGSVFQEKTGGPFQVQEGAFIPGFLEALKLMRKGAKYRVYLPPNIAYDAVPAQPGMDNPLKGQILIFDIEVKEVMTAADVQMRQMQQQQMMQQQMGGDPAAAGNEAAPEPEAGAEKAAEPKAKK